MTYGIVLYQTCPPTPFDINQLHLVVALSRQRSVATVDESSDFRGGSFQPLTHLSASEQLSEASGSVASDNELNVSRDTRRKAGASSLRSSE
jgi:hypothetical protein